MHSKFNLIFDDIIKQTYSQFMIDALVNMKHAIIALHEILSEHNINYTIIGGAAIEEYGYARFTEDIDILVDAADKDKLLSIPPGFIKQITERTLRLHSPAIKIEVIYTDDKLTEGALPFSNPKDVSELRSGIPFLTLPWLVQYKISAGKYGIDRKHKDYADVVVLIKKYKLPRDFGTTNNFRQDLMNEYISIYDSLSNKSV